jgi:hypothetical protein
MPLGAIRCRCGWRDRDHEQKERTTERFACSAFGCPLPGTSGGQCHIHDAHGKPQTIQALTSAINKRRALYRAVASLYAECDEVMFWHQIPGRFAQPFRDHSRLDLLPTQDERRKTRAGWYARALRDLEKEVMADAGLIVNIPKPKEKEQPAEPAKELKPFELSPEDLAAMREAEAKIEAGEARLQIADEDADEAAVMAALMSVRQHHMVVSHP